MALKIPAPNRRFDILAIDRVALDIVLKVQRLPGHGEKEVGDFVGNLPGGPAANFACAAARQGMSVAALATLGDDEAAKIIIDDFQDYGVDTSYVRKDPSRQSNFTVILLEPSGERSIIAVPAPPHVYETELLNESIRPMSGHANNALLRRSVCPYGNIGPGSRHNCHGRYRSHDSNRPGRFRKDLEMHRHRLI